MNSPFDALDQPTLAMLLREYLLAGHLIDRAGMPHVIGSYGIDAMREIAIEEWMGASPVYTQRIRDLLGFSGTNVATIFKGMQFDIGAPPQFMDFRYQVTDDNHGEFWLDCCGALMDVEPLGDEFVVTMCHHIEDPTFDATAAATSPHARMRPIHRPPRVPGNRTPHCHWTVDIDPANDPLPVPEAARRMSTARAATVHLPRAEPTADGSTNYRGALDPNLRFETFAKSTLIDLLNEVALQGHLLTLSFTNAIEARDSLDAATEIGVKQFTGIAGVTAARLKKALDTEDITSVLDLHPAFHPRSYIDVTVGTGALTLNECPALGDRPGRSWADVLTTSDAPLDAIVHAVDPRARMDRTGDLEWKLVIGDEPTRVSPDVAVTAVSTGSTFVFEER